MSSNKKMLNCEFSMVPLADEEDRRMAQSPKDACFFLRKRYFVIVWSFLGLMILFLLRINLSICIVDMTSKKTIILENRTYIQEPEYSWTSSTKGLILSSFSWGYLSTPLIIKFVQKVGASNSYNLSIFLTGIFTLLSPFLIQSGVYIYIAGRFLEGVFEGAALVSMYGIFVPWVPSNERSRLINFCRLGASVGVLVGYPICGYISHIFNWKYVFYITGTSASIWSLVWCATIRSSPSEDFFITESERIYLPTVTEKVPEKQVPIAWKSILKSPPILAFLNETFVQSWSVSFLMFCFPLFIKDMHDVSMDQIGIFSIFPHLAALISRISTAWVQDYLRNKETMSKTKIHKTCILFGQITGVILLILTGLVNDFFTCLIILCAFKAFFGLAETSYTILAVEMAPNYAAQIEAFVILSMSLGYLLNPLAMGFLVAHRTQAEWNHYFWFLCIFNIWGIAIFSWFGSAETLSWAALKDQM